jgi:hypothetical protein
MPGGDRTGPVGQGPRTGRGAGYCGPGDEPGFATAGGRGGFGFGRGRGFGAGRGFGRGWGRWFGFAASEEAPRADNEADRLRAQVEELKNRLARLEQKD